MMIPLVLKGRSTKVVSKEIDPIMRIARKLQQKQLATRVQQVHTCRK